MIREEQLLEQKEVRDQLAGRVDVLDKVKSLLLIPQTEVSTIKQVADFYEVDDEAIKTIVFRHDYELVSDGMKRLSGKETKDFLVSCNLQPTNFRGYFDVDGIKFANKSNLIIPRRAILRIGMLLQNSSVAKEIRTQLLNIEEKTSNEVKTQDLNEEQKLAIEIGMSYISGNLEQFANSSAKMMAFKNRHIEQLQQDNKALAGEILTWENRSKMVFAIRKLAPMLHKPVGYMWSDLYKELKYKHHIDVKMRGDKPYIEHVKPNEWNKVIQSFSAICEDNDISPSDILNNLEDGGQANE